MKCIIKFKCFIECMRQHNATTLRFCPTGNEISINENIGLKYVIFEKNDLGWRGDHCSKILK